MFQSTVAKCDCFKSCPRVGGIGQFGLQRRRGMRFKSCPRVGGIPQVDTPWAAEGSFKSCPRVGGILMH